MPKNWFTSSQAALRCIVAIVILGAFGLWVPELRGEPLEQWYWRNPLPQGNSLDNVVFVNDRWIALGDLGTILISDDGTNWVRHESGVLDTLRDCAYGAGQYVIVGDLGTVLTSCDGLSWVQQYAGTFFSLNGVTYAGGQFVAVGEQTTIVTSVDGVNWTPRSSGDWDLYDVTWAQGTFVAVGGRVGTASTPQLGLILTSPDARMWTRRVLTPEGPFLTVACGDGRVATCAAGGWSQNQRIWVSADAMTWEPSDAPVPYLQASLFYGQGQWLLAPPNLGSYYYWPYGPIFVSTNLLDWTEAVTNSVPIGGIAAGKGRFVASRPDGTFLLSSSGTSWMDLAPASFSFTLADVKYLNGSLVGVSGQQVVFSPDGGTWTNIVTLTNTSNLRSITYGNGRYVAGGEGRTIWTSTDGANWTNPAPELISSLYGVDVVVAYGNGVFVGVAGDAGDILTSPDGLNWMVQQLETNTSTYVYFSDITFGNGRFVAVSPHAIATSTDGTNWYFNDAFGGLTAVTYGNGKFVAVGDNVTSTSTDGTNWTAQTSARLGLLMGVAFGQGFFVATASSSYWSLSTETPIWVSTDGIHWSSRHSNTSRSLSKVAFGNGTFIISGGMGALLQSDPLVNLELTMDSSPQLLLQGPLNRSYRLEYSDGFGPTNRWIELSVVRVTDNAVSFRDPAWTNSAARFYRAVLLP